MDIDRAHIEVLFSKIPPEIILHKCIIANRLNTTNGTDVIKRLRNSIIQYLTEILPGYSDDEREQVYQLMLQKQEQSKIGSLFNVVSEFNHKVLVEYDYQPYCRYEHILRWRMLSLKLEQDFFVTSYLAERDIESMRVRTNYTWEPVIKTDNFRLHNMLQRGIAENHFHLKGSAPCYHLSWISLMNRVTNRRNEFKAAKMLDNKLNREVWFEERLCQDSFRNLIVKAALVRKFLGEQILYPEVNPKSNLSEGEDTRSKQTKYQTLLKRLGKTDDELILEYRQIDDELQALRWTNKSPKFMDTRIDTVDYMIDARFLTPDNNNYKMLLYGERKFMYECFKRFLARTSDKSFKRYETLFYFYLVVKNRFRSEIIQVNNRVGFKNFGEYQDRKTKFLVNEPILKKAVNYMAVKATEEGQNIEKLEARISPEQTAAEMRNTILNIDKEIDKIGQGILYDSADELLQKIKNEYIDKQQGRNIQRAREYPCFYVIHAIKGRDKYNQKIIENEDRGINLEIRDIKKRKEAKNLALQLMTLREKRFEVASRVFGVDAASNEIGCRPEVFAQAFRALRQHTVSKQFDLIYYLGVSEGRNFEQSALKIPPLKVTYHAGEDFLDVSDGLRAIDEAVEYMNLSHGERIGHALALGIDVPKWYKSKNNMIVIKKQDYLDNICWLLNKIDLWKVPVEHSSYQYLRREYEILFKEVYQKVHYCHHEEYYDAWLLRGDNPRCYQEKKYVRTIPMSFWDRCDINEQVEKGYEKRNNKTVTSLYHLYHYDFDVRKEGNVSINKKLDDEYIEVVRRVQLEMQQRLKHKGIGIETNPSSNYCIGTFKRYDQHPIAKFYNLGLTYDKEELKRCPQLFVSINTDDQGVFDTYLENEYALLALAMEKAKDENNRLLYNQEMIYDWLERIRLMGLQQSFI